MIATSFACDERRILGDNEAEFMAMLEKSEENNSGDYDGRMVE